MKAVVQRVESASLSCDGKLISEIKKGLVVYFGVGVGDSEKQAEYLAKKISALRVFSDENGKMNLSCKDLNLEILSVSQFTLYADVSHGNRPGFSGAEEPVRANALYEYFCLCLAQNGITVKKGVFGGDMTISQVNQGPVTIIYDI
ncbi:MAG: D-tyrosyl-tRNA(Tyr) deacylase [Clostridia bacterium]|nr:D-tyrosyl-tRNA(Tyr) deacylase [Clostridia bacterium]